MDRWPCDPEVEQPNYRGFTYLVEALAAEGFVAIAPNFNAENTFGFGEGTPASGCPSWSTCIYARWPGPLRGGQMISGST